MSKVDIDSLVTRREIAQALHVHPATITRWTSAGQFPAPVRTPNGALLGWQRADLNAWIQAQTAQRSTTEDA